MTGKDESVKRYALSSMNPGSLFEADKGELVRYDDHVAHVAMLESVLEKISALKYPVAMDEMDDHEELFRRAQNTLDRARELAREALARPQESEKGPKGWYEMHMADVRLNRDLTQQLATVTNDRDKAYAGIELQSKKLAAMEDNELSWISQYAGLQTKNDKLQASNDKLRAALERIHDTAIYHQTFEQLKTNAHLMAMIAEEALREGGE